MTLPEISLPKATARGCFLTSGRALNVSLKPTVVIVALGTSNPEYDSPGTTAANLAATPPNRREISWTYFSTFLEETFDSYSTLNLVMDGPIV